MLSYGYLMVVNVGLLLAPVKLSYDWQTGSLPLISSILDPRNLLTAVLLLLLSCLIWRCRPLMVQIIKSSFNRFSLFIMISGGENEAEERHRRLEEEEEDDREEAEVSLLDFPEDISIGLISSIPLFRFPTTSSQLSSSSFSFFSYAEVSNFFLLHSSSPYTLDFALHNLFKMRR